MTVNPDLPKTELPALAAPNLPPHTVALLRHHNLLLPLLAGLVEEAAVADISLDPEESNNLIARWAGKQGVESALEQAANTYGLSREDVIWQVERPAKLTRLARKLFMGKVEARFLQRKDDLDLVSYSLLRVKDSNLAREIYLQLSAGEAEFAELASKYSDGPERQSRGLVGPNPISKAHPMLASRLRSASDGEVMPPFAIADWWLVVRREFLKAAVLDDAMVTRMAMELQREWINAEARRVSQQLHSIPPIPPTSGA